MSRVLHQAGGAPCLQAAVPVIAVPGSNAAPGRALLGWGDDSPDRVRAVRRRYRQSVLGSARSAATVAPGRRAGCPGGGAALRLWGLGQGVGGALERFRPELVLCAGQAGGRARISLERVAINCDDARIPDNAGNQPVDEARGPGRTGGLFHVAARQGGARGAGGGADPGGSVPECRDLCLQPRLLRAHARPAAPSRHPGRLVHVPYATPSCRPGAVPRRCRSIRWRRRSPSSSAPRLRRRRISGSLPAQRTSARRAIRS